MMIRDSKGRFVKGSVSLFNGKKHSMNAKKLISEANSGRISHRIGKTFEEEYGTEEAKRIKKKISANLKGKQTWLGRKHKAETFDKFQRIRGFNYCKWCDKIVWYKRSQKYFCDMKCYERWRYKNKPGRRQICEKWKKENPKQHRNLQRRWEKKNRFKHLDIKRRYRVSKSEIIEQFSFDEWQEKIEATGGFCPCCNRFIGIDNLECDHIFPISKALPGRIYTIDDVQPLCRSCNAKKAASVEL